MEQIIHLILPPNPSLTKTLIFKSKTLTFEKIENDKADRINQSKCWVLTHLMNKKQINGLKNDMAHLSTGIKRYQYYTKYLKINHLN